MNKEASQVVLLNSNNFGNYVQGTFKREHLGLGYLTAELRARGFSTRIIDSRIMGYTPEQATQEILDCQPSLVGFSIIAKSADRWCEQVARQLKTERSDVHITMGNYFPSLQPARALASMPSIDSIVMYEGDTIFPDLVSSVISERDWHVVKGMAYRTDESVRINSGWDLIRDLDSLPFPAHDTYQHGLDEFAIEGSRGCYCRCTFCSIVTFLDSEQTGERWRARSPQNIAAEISGNLKRYPDIRKYRFVDPDFVGASGPGHIQRLENIAEEFYRIGRDFEYIIDTRTEMVNTVPRELWHRLKNSGLAEVYLGVETANPHIKKMMRKGFSFEEDVRAIETLENLGIRVRYGFMMITPWTTENDIEVNAQALHGLGFPRLDKYFQEMYVVPGTRAVELTQEITDIWFDHNGEGEYYTYGLPQAIDNLRRISRSLTINSLAFLLGYQSLHEGIRQCLESPSGEDVTRFKDELNDFSFDFFLAVFNQAKELDSDVTDEAIDIAARSLASNYQVRLDSLQRNFESRKEK